MYVSRNAGREEGGAGMPTQNDYNPHKITGNTIL
jgi:hypothetical protein